MAVKAVLNQPFDVVLSGAAPDRVGDITLEVYNLTDGTVILAASALNITQPRPGTYVAVRSLNTLGSDYMGRWVLDGASVGEESIVVTKYPVPDPGVGVVPDSDDVADLMFARTKTGGGGFKGVFDETTTPTKDRVERFILSAYQSVIDVTGEITNPDLVLSARNAIKYRTGMFIELSAELMNKEKYDELQALYDAEMKILVEAEGAFGTTAIDEQARVGSTAHYGFDGPRIGDVPW